MFEVECFAVITSKNQHIKQIIRIVTVTQIIEKEIIIKHDTKQTNGNELNAVEFCKSGNGIKQAVVFERGKEMFKPRFKKRISIKRAVARF